MVPRSCCYCTRPLLKHVKEALIRAQMMLDGASGLYTCRPHKTVDRVQRSLSVTVLLRQPRTREEMVRLETPLSKRYIYIGVAAPHQGL